MATPTTLEEFVTEARRETKAAQEAVRRFTDEVAEANKTYLTAWITAQQAGLRATFDFQNAAMQASRTLFDATAEANRAYLGQWAVSIEQSQAGLVSLVTAATRLAEAGVSSQPIQ